MPFSRQTLENQAAAKIVSDRSGCGRNIAAMHIVKRPLSKHHRARLIAWTLAMLTWMTSVLFAGAPFTDRHERRRRAHMSLDRLERMVIMLIVSRARDFICERPRRKFTTVRRGHTLLRPGMLRALVGSSLRKTLRRKDVRERMTVLLYAIRNIDLYAAPLAKRLRRGLTKRWPIGPTPTPDEVVESLTDTLAIFADSS
jgi:hypothetical protein